MRFSDIWNLHLVVFAPLFTLHIPPPTRSFQQLGHILPCLIPSLYDLLQGNLLHLLHAATPSVVNITPFNYNKWDVPHPTTKEYCRVFDVYVALEKSLDKRHTYFLPPCNPLFTTVTVKLFIHGLI